MCIDLNQRFSSRKLSSLLDLEPLCRALSNGTTHTSVAAFVSMLLVVFTGVTHVGQTIAIPLPNMTMMT